MDAQVEVGEVASRYLEAIYYIVAEGESVRSARLADWLGVSRPTVAVALRRMERDGLLSLDARKEISLTPAGRSAAADTVRRHRIVERWLTDQLGLDWVTADTEASRLEHSLSDLVTESLFESLGRPTTCPHGNPIPGVAEIDAAEVKLSDLREHEDARVTRISEVAEREAPALLGYLHSRHLVPGTRLNVDEVDEVGGTLRVRIGDGQATLSCDTASRVWVLPG